MEDHEGQHIYVQIMKAELHVIYCFLFFYFFILGNRMKTMSSYWISVLDKLSDTEVWIELFSFVSHFDLKC